MTSLPSWEHLVNPHTGYDDPLLLRQRWWERTTEQFCPLLFDGSDRQILCRCPWCLSCWIIQEETATPVYFSWEEAAPLLVSLAVSQTPLHSPATLPQTTCPRCFLLHTAGVARFDDYANGRGHRLRWQGPQQTVLFAITRCDDHWERDLEQAVSQQTDRSLLRQEDWKILLTWLLLLPAPEPQYVHPLSLQQCQRFARTHTDDWQGLWWRSPFPSGSNRLLLFARTGTIQTPAADHLAGWRRLIPLLHPLL